MVDLRLHCLRRFGIEHQATALALSLFPTACAPTDNYFIDTSSPFSEAGGHEAGMGGMGIPPRDGASSAGGSSNSGGGNGGGSGGSSATGTGGSATGTGGSTNGTGGSTNGTGGSATGAGGSGGNMAGGDASAARGGNPLDASGSDARDAAVPTLVDAGGTLLFADDFENDTLGAPPPGWTRVGGSSGDWTVVTDSTKVLAQANSPSSTLRVCYAGAVTSTAASVSARAKLTQNGSSGTTTAMICIRYVAGNGDYHCLALEGGVGLQIRTNQGDGPVWGNAIALGTWYRLKLSVDATGLLSAYFENNLVGTFRPPVAIGSGSVAVSTQSAEAAFDDVVLSSP